MKKKLLTILLSIAVILTSTVTVFAINITNSGDIFNTVNDVNRWTNEHGIAFANLYDYNDELLNQEVKTEDGVIYTFSYDNVDYALMIMNDKLFSIEVRKCTVDDYNGIYTAPTIAQVLATVKESVFPTSISAAWTNSNDKTRIIYLNGDKLTIGTISGNNPFSKGYEYNVGSTVNDEENSYVFETEDYRKIIFNIHSDALISITLESSDSYEGTYMPLSIGDVLPDSFPNSENDKSWHNSTNDDCYVYKGDTSLLFYDIPIGVISLTAPLTRAEHDPNWSDTTTCRWVYSDDINDIVIQFNMTGDYGNELENIVVAHCQYEACEGTYAAPDAFSVTYNANGATSGTAPTNQTKTSGVGLTLATNTGNLAKVGYTFAGWNTKVDGSGTHYDTGATYTTDEDLNLYAEWIEAPATKTIADILPEDFPTFSWPLPDNVWKNSVGSKMYINNNGLTFGGVSLYNILSKPVTKDGNNYKYISDPYTITFVMDSGKLVKVITEGAENADNNGEYLPPKSSITPSVSLTGWTYGANPNTPSVEGNTGEGEVTYEYKLKDAADTTYTTTVPTKAGTYTIKATIVETTDYQAGSDTSEFTISKKQLEVTGTTAKNKTYDGKTSGEVDNIGTLSGKIGTDDVSIDKVTITYGNANVGGNKPVTVSYTIKGDDASNYLAPIDNTSLTSTITKADMEKGKNITAPCIPLEKLVYDGTEKDLLCAGLTYDEKDGSTAFGTFYYSADGVNWSKELPTAIYAGEYNPLWYFIGDDNHNNIGSREEPISQLYPVVIDGQPFLDVVMNSYTYDKQISVPRLENESSLKENPTITYYYSSINDNKNGTEWKDITPTSLEVGNYYMYAVIADTTTYKGYTTNTSKFSVLSNSTVTEGNISTATLNTNENVKETKLKPISKANALTIVGEGSLKQAINNGGKVIIYTEVEKPSEESKQAFTSLNINESNAVILDINLYGEVVGEANSKKQITDTNGYKTTISITLTPSQASKISISSDKNYFVLRKHANQIVKIPATLTTDTDGNYVFTFETDKFSAYAITSENKPIPTPDSKPRYKIPNTGIDDTYSNNHSLLKLSSLSLLAIGTYLVIKKKKDND